MIGYKLLLVEDEASLAHLVSIQLKTYGHKVKVATNTTEARDSICNEEFDLILLDWMLPDENGVDFLRWMKSSSDLDIKTKPVIFVTALTTPVHIIQALELGADDYVTKPFEESVLVARINAVMRRSQKKNSGAFYKPDKSGFLNVGDLKLDPKAFEVYLKDERLNLTRSEFLLLKHLMSELGCVLTRETLISKVQGTEINVTGRTVDTHIFGLRKKLKEYSHVIETIRGVGYRFNSPVSTSSTNSATLNPTTESSIGSATDTSVD